MDTAGLCQRTESGHHRGRFQWDGGAHGTIPELLAHREVYPDTVDFVHLVRIFPCSEPSLFLSPESSVTDRRLTFCASRVKVMLISIPFGFLRKCGPAIYSDIDRYEDMLSSGKLSPKDEVRSNSHCVWYTCSILMRATRGKAEKCPLSHHQDVPSF